MPDQAREAESELASVVRKTLLIDESKPRDYRDLPEVERLRTQVQELAKKNEHERRVHDAEEDKLRHKAAKASDRASDALLDLSEEREKHQATKGQLSDTSNRLARAEESNAALRQQLAEWQQAYNRQQQQLNAARAGGPGRGRGRVPPHQARFLLNSLANAPARSHSAAQRNAARAEHQEHFEAEPFDCRWNDHAFDQAPRSPPCA